MTPGGTVTLYTWDDLPSVDRVTEKAPGRLSLSLFEFAVVLLSTYGVVELGKVVEALDLLLDAIDDWKEVTELRGGTDGMDGIDCGRRLPAAACVGGGDVLTDDPRITTCGWGGADAT